MTANTTGLQLYIGASSDVQKGLSQAVSEVQKAAAQMRQGVAGVGAETAKANQASRNWIGTLQRYRTEQAQQARSARFFASEIASIIPVSREAGTALQALSGMAVEGLAGGLGIGLAIEGVRALVGIWRQAAEATEEARRKASEYSAELLKARVNQIDTLGQAIDQLALARAQTPVDRQRVENAIAEREARAKLAATEKETQTALLKVYADQSAAGNRARADIQARVLAARAELAAVIEIGRVRVQNILDEAEAKRKAGPLGATFVDAQVADRAVLNGMTAAELSEVRSTPTVPFGGSALQEWQATIAEMNKSEESLAEERRKRSEEMKAAMAEARSAAMVTGDTIGQAFAQAFAEGEKGAARFGMVMLDQVIATVQARAVEAAATAFAGNAWNVFGATAASTAAFSFVRGLLSQLPRRALGGPVQAGQPYLVGERGPEVVVPRSSGTVVPNHELGGGDLHLHVSALDGASVERVLTTNNRDLMRALRRARRYGR